MVGLYLSAALPAQQGSGLPDRRSNQTYGEASIPIGNHCATIAAQVEHVILYLEGAERSIAGQKNAVRVNLRLRLTPRRFAGGQLRNFTINSRYK